MSEAAAARPSGLPEGVPWPPARPPPIDFEQAIREHNAGRSEPHPYQVWEEKLNGSQRSFVSGHTSSEEALKAANKLNSDAKAVTPPGKKPATRARVWCWATGEEVRP